MDGPEILNTVDQIEKLDKVARRTFGISDAKEDQTQWAVNIAILNVWSRKREQLCRQSVAINLLQSPARA